jgi:hypothetical protein
LIPILVDLAFVSSALGFEDWWLMWKTHAFWRALGSMLQQIHAECEIPEEEVLPSTHHFFLLTSLNPFLIPFTLLQQEDGPEPKNDDGSNFQFLPIARVVLFGKNAPPPSKSIMQIQPSTAKLTPKRRRSSDVVAPRAHAKTRKVLVRKIQKAAGPSSTSQEAPVAS